MYNSGDAAEQVVRMSLEGAEFALKITGSAAKNLAAALYTVLKDQKKTKGKARIEAMLRDIQAQRKKEAEAARAEEPAAPQKKAAQKTTRHQPPQPKKKPKSKER